MKKNRGIIIVAAFALVILGALAVAGWYQLKCITHLQEEVYVVRDADVAKNLLRGRKPENSSSELFKVDASEPVYQRGGGLYVGQGKEKVDAVFPFFANNGEAVMLVKNDQVLLDKQFEEVSTFPGMYVSDGLSFNYDKSQADDESYLFLKLSNGLFMNAQLIQFDYPGGQEKMRMNSIFCFEKDAVRYYGMQPEHSLWYGELPTVNMLMVTIGGETYSYEQFLGLLGLAGKDYKPNAADTGNTSVSPETGNKEEEVREEENNQDIQEEPELSGAEKTETDKADKEKEDTKQTGNKDKTEAEKQVKEKNKKEKKNNNQQNTGSSGTGNSSAAGGSSAGGTVDSSTGSGAAGTENSGSESKPDLSGDDLSGNDLSGNDLSGNDVSGSNSGFVRPDVSLDDFTADIYSIFSTLKIDDPAYVMKRVVIELYWQPVDEKTGEPAADSGDREKYDLRYRKTFRSAGDIELDNLPPDTTIYAKATVYYMSRGETESFEFYDGFEKRVRTKPMDELDDIYLTFHSTKSDTDLKVLPHQMQIFDLAASGPNPNVLNKVSRVQINVTGTDDLHKGETYSCLMSISDFRNRYCYTGEPEMEPAVSDDVSGNDVSGNDVSGNDVSGNDVSDNDPGGSDDGAVKPRVDWTSVRESMDLPSNMTFTYEIKLLDSFGNAFTKIVNGYHGKARKTADGEAVDWKVEKSLTCCEKKEVVYYTPRGEGYTSKTEPSVVMKQAAFEDNEHNIDRAKYEITMLDPDGAAEKFKNNYYMELYMEDENGLITESAEPVECFYEVSGSSDTRQETSRFTLPNESIVHNAIKQYEITGLTAGKIYELRIYGYYELNDQINAEADITKPAQLINSQRFSTADLSSLGSVMYTLANKHVKTEIWPNGNPKVSEQPDGSVVNEISPYESATAQELSMQINYGYNMTNRKLSEMISEIYVEVKDTTKEGEDAVIMSAVLDRSKMENATYTGTGDTDGEKRFELNLKDLIKDGTQVKSTLKDKDGNPYIPKLYLETQDIGSAEEKVWDAFVSETTKAKLVFFWEDGSLTSNTSYRLDVQTLARQGGLNHDVTARGAAYRSLNFTTLKKMPYVTWDSILIVSDYIKIEGLDFHDEDNSILEGMVQKNLFGYTNGLPFSIESGNEKIAYPTEDEKYGLLELLEYNGLVIGDDYRVDLAPATIRRDSAGRYTLRRENLFSYQFTAGAGLSGRLIFESIDYPLEQVGDVQYRRDEFRLYNAGGYSMGASFGSTGTVSDTGSNAYNAWAVSPFIPVKPGGLYYIDGIRGNSNTNWMTIAFYTEKNEADENTTQSAFINRDTWKVSDVTTGNVARTFYISSSDNVIKIPAASDGGNEIRYMRFNMIGRDTSTYITAYAAADCFVLDDGDKKVEGAVEKIDSAKFVREATNNWYYKLDNQPVAPGEKYVVGNGVHRYTYTFNDESGNVIKTGDSGQYMVSPVFTVPEGAARMTLRTYNSSSYRGGESLELYKLNTEKLEWLRSRDIDKFANSLTVKVEDKLDNLIPEKNREVFLEVWQVNADGSKVKVDLGGGKMEMQVTADEQNRLSTLDFEQLVSFDGSSNKKFEMELYVKYNGDKITLDTMEFETNRTLECIHDRTELAKLMRYPSGDFIVVNDIELRNGEGFYFGNGSNTPFRGTLDFQGHSMTVNGGWTGISTVESGGVVKNLSLRSRRNGSSSSNYGLVTTNRGTLQNIVLELDLGEGMYRKDNVSGLCNANYGTIENFSLYYTGTSSMYVGYYFGGLCRENYGVIKNGYAYCPGTLSVTTAVYGGSTARNCAYSSLVVSRSWGDIKNVYVVGDLSVERYTDDGTLANNALLTKVESGLVSNCISVGDFNRIIWTGSTTKTRLKQTYTTYGPMVAGNISATTTSIKNNYYYSNVAEPYAKNYTGVQEQVKDAALFQDSSFYDRTINSESAFEMADISSGYLPRVTMPYDELMMRQQKAPLVASSSDISTSYAFARVDEIYRENDVKNSEAKDYANVTLMFRNRLEREINDVTIDGLTVEARDGYTAKAGEPKFEQYTEGGYYIVKVKLSVDKNRENEKGEREVLYRKKYDVTGFTYNQTYNAEVKNRQIELMFPRLVTQDNWVMGYDTVKKQWLTVFEDMQGCYRLGTDIDYTQFSSEDITGPTGTTPKNRRKAAMEVFARRTGNQTTFYGSLDGQDVKDETKQYALKNFRLGKDCSSYVYLINSAQGAELKNFKVENLTIDQDGFTTAYSGLVSISSSDSRFENIVIQNVTLSNVYRYSGALIGQSGFATVQDCVLKGFRAESRASAYTDFRIGGFIGYADRGGRLENCYAAEVRIDALKGTSSSGVGALIGSGNNNPWIINCYAQGKIDSSFQYTGGLIGQGGIISGTWSKVNVTSSNRYTGGISGSGSTIKNTLVLGEVFCSAPDSYNRVSSGSTKLASCFVSELQKLNSIAADADSGDAEGIMTVAEMKKEFWYWDKLNMGKAFDYTVVESGNLPRLKYKDGHDILPLQDVLYMIEPASVPFTAEGIAEDNFNPDWAAGAAGSDDISTKVHEYDLSVTLQFRYEDGKQDPSNGNVEAFKALFRGADGEAYGRLSIEDMDFVKTDGVVKEVESSYSKIDGVPTYSLIFKVTPQRYLDSYRVVWDTGQDQENAMLVFQKEENGEKKDMILYRYIYRVQDTAAIAAAYQNKEGIYADPGSWQGAMRLAGDSLENFKIMEDLDFSEIKSASDTAGDEYLILKTALKINRLEGVHQNFSMGDESLTELDRREYLMSDTLKNADADLDFIEIRNLTFETSSSGVNWISELRADMRYLRFQGINWTGSGSYTGVVRSLRGNLSYVDIDTFVLRYKSTGDYMGFFISSSGNKAEYLRGRDIEVRREDSVTNTTGAASYVGGIFANSSGLVQHVGIKGAAPAPGENKNDAKNWTYRVEGRLPSVEDKDNKNYTGGLGGNMGGSGLIFAYAENIYVEGNGYVGAISGSQASYGSYEEAQFKAVQTEGKDTVYLHETDNCYVRGKNYVGGITGNTGPRWSISKNNEVYAENLHAGGVAGAGSGYYNRAIDCTITARNGYAGGLGGTSGQHYNRSEVQGCVISAPRYVGGMAPNYSSSGSNYNGGTVHDSIIWGEEFVGGIWGYSDDTGVTGAFVGNCYIGSQGEDNMPQLIKKDDGTYEIKEKDPSRAESAKGTHIGGIIGYSCGGRVTNTLVDDDVRIYGKDFVGGVVGDGGGGAKVSETGSANIESGANVYVSGSYGGGYTGRLVGFEQSSKGPDILNRPVTKIDKVIITGKVTASANAEYIGAFAGCYRAYKEGLDNDGRPLDPEKGFKKNDLDTGYREYMSGSYIRRVTLALTEVSGGRDPELIGKTVNPDSTEAAVNQGAEHKLIKEKSDGTIEQQETEYEGIGYLRVYGAMKIGYNSTAGAKYPSWDRWNYTNSEMPGAEKAKIVTTANLKTIDFYYAPLIKGGQEMRGQGEGNVKYFENDGRTYRFYYFYYRNDNEGDTANPTTTIFPYITYSGSESKLYVYERQPDGTTQKQCQFGIPIPNDGINVTFLDISEALDHVSTYASGAGSVNLEFPEILVTEEPAGEEGIMLMSLDEETVQSAGDTQKAASGALQKASGMLRTSAVKAATGIQTMADMEAAVSDIAAESTEEVITPVSYFQIYDENGELLYEDRIGKQVYTIPYDFEKTLTVKVFAGNEARSYMLTGETLKHTVMTWNDHCYYLKSDGIYRDKGVYTDDGSEGEKDYANTEKVREGAFLHLYQGEALDEEGNIIDVVSGKSTEKLDTETLYLPAEEEIPAYETSYGGEEILTYRTFSTTQDDEVVSDYRLFAHNDKLFGMDPELDQPYGQKFWNFVADYYSTSKGSTEYLSVLNENFVLEDCKTALNWPVEEKSGKNMLRNYQIREVGDNLNADRSYVIIRYYDNTAAAFDYLTGSLLFVDDSEKKELGFVEFANMWLLGKKESLNNANAYLGAKGLVEKLSENPVDDDLVAGYLANQALKGGNAEADDERTDLAIDGTNDADGSSMLSGVDNRNPDFGVNASGTGSESQSGEGVQGANGTEIVNTTGKGSADKAQGDTAIGEGMSAPVQSTGNAEASGTGIAGAGNEIVVDMTGDAAGGNGSDNALGDTAGTGIGKGDRESAGAGAGTGAGEGTGTGIGKETGTGADIKDGVGTGAGEGAGSGSGIGVGDGTAEKENGIAGAGGNGTAGNSKEAGMTDTGAADAEAETKDQKEASETGDGVKKDAAAEDSALPDPTSDRAYVTMLTADAGGYEVFRATELLSKRGSAAMSENQKIKLLEASGLLQNAVDLESMKLTSEENRTGLILVGTAAAAMMMLLGLLYYKKRKMNQMM